MDMETKLASQLFDCILAEDTESVRKLLEFGADPNVVLPSGAAPLHVAVGTDNGAVSDIMTTLLLGYGADPNIRSSDGSTPMHIAATYSRVENLKVLLDNGGDPTLQDYDGLGILDASNCELCHAVIKADERLDRRQMTGEESVDRRQMTDNYDILVSEENDSSNSTETFHTCDGEQRALSGEWSRVDDYTVIHKGVPVERRHKQSSQAQRPAVAYSIPTHTTGTEREHVTEHKSRTRSDDNSHYSAWDISVSGGGRNGTRAKPVLTTQYKEKSGGIMYRTFVVQPAQEILDKTYALPTEQQQHPLSENYRQKTFHSDERRQRDGRDDTARSSDFEFDARELPSMAAADTTYAKGSPVMCLTSRIEELRLTAGSDRRSRNKENARPSAWSVSSDGGLCGEETIVQRAPPAPSSRSGDRFSGRSRRRGVLLCGEETIVQRAPPAPSSRSGDRFSGHARRRGVLLDDSLSSVTSENFTPNVASTSLDTEDEENFSLEVGGRTTLHRHLGEVEESETSVSSSSTARSTCSCPARGEEMIITDEEAGFSLVEVHLPAEPCACASTCSTDDSAHACSPHSDTTLLYDWKEGGMSSAGGSSGESGGGGAAGVPRQITALTDAKLRSCLLDLGEFPGPVTPSTRKQYEMRLMKLRRDPTLVHRQSPTTSEFLPELNRALDGLINLSCVQGLEDDMHRAFASPDPNKHWREGTKKASFNYLLLDPRVTQNLPMRSKSISHEEGFRIFIKSVFYVGKGRRTRPYAHFKEAMHHINDPQKEPSPKVQQIIDIWKGGFGVISLHVFQNTIPVEAYTRESCMIEAFGLARLTNKCKGQSYGPATKWNRRDSRLVGVRLLKKAYHILLFEGERQIKPHDVKTR